MLILNYNIICSNRVGVATRSVSEAKNVGEMVRTEETPGPQPNGQ